MIDLTCNCVVWICVIVTLVAEVSFMVEKHVSIPKPFSTGNITEWFQQFEICCRANGWNHEAKAVKLPTLLEGEVIAIWLELSKEEQGEYKTTKKLAYMQENNADKIHFT